MPLTFYPGPAGSDRGNLHKGGVLVIAVPSLANIAQMSVDILVASSPSASLVGYLDSDHHAPMCGNEAFGSTTNAQLCVPVELYRVPAEGESVLLLQHRAPLLRGHATVYAEELAGWAAKQQFSQVILLAGAAVAGNETALDLSARLWYKVSQAMASPPAFHQTWEQRFNVQPFMPHDTPHAPVPSHAGISAQLLAACERAAVPTTALFMFTEEGNNTQDSVVLANVLASTFLMDGQAEAGGAIKFVAPRSWENLWGRRQELV